MWVSQVTPGRKSEIWFEIIGATQTLQWNSEPPDEMWVGARDADHRILLRDPVRLARRAAARSTYPAGHAEGYPDTFKGLFSDFYEYVEAGDFGAPRPFPTFEDGHREIAIGEAIERS
jgi:hypothetical protein